LSADGVDVVSTDDDALGEMKSEIMQLVEGGFDSFVSSSHVLVSALDELSKAHPFVRGEAAPLYLPNEAPLYLQRKSHTVAFLAFKAVIELDIKRRENDKRILALRYQMQDMMRELMM
jgi:predicted secreted protein